MLDRPRRQYAILSQLGLTYFHRQNPYIVAWWSAAFPGFGHYFLNQYFRATLLTLCEVIINTLGNVNQAIIFSLCGQFELAKSVLQPSFAVGYTTIFFFTIWDSYRSTLTQNKLCHLAEFENEQLPATAISPFEIQYLELRKPWLAAFYSFLFPCLGQLYNHRWGLAFYGILWWWLYVFLSHSHEAIIYLVLGEYERAKAVLNPHWLLFMPSVMGCSIYHAFMAANDNNRLFRLEQRRHLIDRYHNSSVCIFGK